MYIVTGASDGLGKEVAKILLGRGEEVVGLSRTRSSLDIRTITVDLRSAESVSAAVKEILSLSEPITGLINCAGVEGSEIMGGLSYKELQSVIGVNLVGPMLLVSGLYDRLIDDKSDVVNVASTVGFKAYNRAAYGASKWAMRGVSANLSEQFKSTDCRCISFCTGGFISKILEKSTGQVMNDPENWMDPVDVANFMVQIMDLPKNMEVTEVVINRKARR